MVAGNQSRSRSRYSGRSSVSVCPGTGIPAGRCTLSACRSKYRCCHVWHSPRRIDPDSERLHETIDVKNINLQIKKHKKTCFFHFYKKTLKNMDKKTLNYTIHSSKKQRQYESNKVNNTATKHSLCPGNGVFAHEKCIIFEILYVFVSKTTKTRRVF